MASASSQLLGRGSIYTFATAAPMLTGLLFTPLLTRMLGILEYDEVSVAIVVMNFTVGLLAFGLPLAITRHAITEETGEPGARGIAITGLVAAFGVGSVVAAALLFTGQPNAVTLGVLVGGVGGGVAMLQAYSLARQDSWFYVALAFGVSLVAPGIGLLAVFAFERSATTYYLAIAVVYLIVILAALARVVSQGAVQFSATNFTRALRIGLPVIPHQIAVGSATGAAVLVAQLQLPAGSSAQTQLSLLVASAPLLIVSAISYAWTPIILRAPESDQSRLLGETAGAVAWLAALGGGALGMLSPWFLAFLAPKEEYGIAEMIPVVAVGSLAASFAAAYLAHYQLVVAKGATSPLAVLSPLALLIGAALTYIAAGRIGIIATGLGFVATFAFLLLFTRAVARRVSAVRWRERRVIAPLLVGITVCALAAVLPWEDIFGVIVRVAAAGSLLGVAAFHFLRAVRKPVANSEGASSIATEN